MSNNLHDLRNFRVGMSDIMHVPSYNKGTAYTKEERHRYKLRGLFPKRIETLEQQAERAKKQFDAMKSNIEKYTYLVELRDHNETLFYYLLCNNIKTMMPIVYTPTVGKACQEFSQVWRNPCGMYLTLETDKGEIREILDNWMIRPDIIVVTDGSRILGLGDLGTGGMGIPIGKLSLYTAGAGFHPLRTLPICIDVGTNNDKLLDDPAYMGSRTERVRGERFNAFMEEFMVAVRDKWPTVLVQFEDFSNDVCFELLERYRNNHLCFNDDIQGTGAVVLSGFINAVKLSKVPLEQHKVLFLGAGSAAVGVADQMAKVFRSGTNFSEEEIKKAFYIVDSAGLVTNNRGDWEKIQKRAPHKIAYARSDISKDSPAQTKDFYELVKVLKPTVIVGLSGFRAGAFDEKVIRLHSEHNKVPIIFALSNPTDKSECTAEEAIKYSDGRAIFASGSPFDPVTYNGKTIIPGQGNNMYIFPGLGLGAVLSKARTVTEDMILSAAQALADAVPEEYLAQGNIYPDLSEIRSISRRIAVAVCKTAFKNGNSLYTQEPDWNDIVEKYVYNPSYVQSM
mmetsp:Transcript_6845/g.9993  ORF Transcript_6845/g.9993 Transcript_6845/m.9993 type:complete len:565 (+) Transcript_6845:52-1746(+)